MELTKPIEHLTNDPAFIKDSKQIYHVLTLAKHGSDRELKTEIDFTICSQDASPLLKKFREHFYDRVEGRLDRLSVSEQRQILLSLPDVWVMFLNALFHLPAAVRNYHKQLQQVQVLEHKYESQEAGLYNFITNLTREPTIRKSSIVHAQLVGTKQYNAITREVHTVLDFYKYVVLNEEIPA